MKRERETWVDVAKGFGILLVVLGHVVSSYHNSGLLKDAAAFNFVHTFAYSFHMPLFFILSGYLAARSERNDNRLGQIGHKLLCLGIPYVVFSLLNWGMKFVMASMANSAVSLRDLLMIWLFPINHMWYIYVLCIMAVIHILLGKLLRKPAGAIAAVLCALGVLIFFSNIPLLPRWGLDGSIVENVANFSIWYLIGVAMAALIRPKACGPAWKLPSVVGVVLFGLLVWLCEKYQWTGTACDLLLSLLGSCLFIMVSMCFRNWKLLAYLGRNSLPIYLIHGIILSALRVGLSLLGIPLLGGAVPMVVCGLAGIVIPLACYQISTKIKILDFCFYPGKFIKKPNRKD